MWFCGQIRPILGKQSNLCRRNRNLNVCLNKKLFVEALKYDVSVYIIAIM